MTKSNRDSDKSERLSGMREFAVAHGQIARPIASHQGMQPTRGGRAALPKAQMKELIRHPITGRLGPPTRPFAAGSASKIRFEDVQGDWTGTYVDANGARGDLIVVLGRWQVEVEGRWELALRAPEHERKLHGIVRGVVGPNGVDLNLALEEGQAIRVHGEIDEALPFALLAIIGQAHAPSGFGVSRGVVVLWRFSAA